MNDIGIIDRFLDVFSRYIDSGFGLVGGEVAWLSATLIVIDMTLAGLFWAMNGDEVMGKLIKKILYVGAFAFIITNFNQLAGIIFNSFAGLGLMASGGTLSQAELLQPGRLASVGIDAGRPIMDHIRTLTGFPDVFLNFDTIFVLLIAWIIVILSFFILAVQLFVTLIEFKLTTLAGFILVPFALWNKTSFLAERVLGHVMMSGVKVLVLAVIIGIGTTIFGEFQAPASAEPTIDEALALMLASLTLFALGIFGPGVASGLISGAPQLGAGAAAGATMAATAAIAGGTAATLGAGRMAGSAAAGAVRSASSLASGARSALSGGAASTTSAGLSGSSAGLAGAGGANSSSQASGLGRSTPTQPAWAKRLQQRQRMAQGISTTAQVIRSADTGGSGPSPNLRESGDA